ncbi:hypothetical protein P4B35_23205 [Pontiellaceae bacterium B12227]|nr:hypothetical protein [Pontiellaceae bacterium B12227]
MLGRNWMAANTVRTEISVHATHAETSCSGCIAISSKNPDFHPSSNPNRKTTDPSLNPERITPSKTASVIIIEKPEQLCFKFPH